MTTATATTTDVSPDWRAASQAGSAAWAACTNPRAMIGNLRRRNISDRKLRLIAVAFARRVESLMTDPRALLALKVAERYADGLATDSALWSAGHKAEEDAVRSADPSEYRPEWAAVAATEHHPAAAAVDAAYQAIRPYTEGDLDGWNRECRVQCDLIRDIAGDPYAAASAVDPAWLAWNGGTVAQLARAIYTERAFDRLPILADALEDAGCTDDAILRHCRGGRPHVRGCWVLDLLLGLE
jgi:hypothetical protein